MRALVVAIGLVAFAAGADAKPRPAKKAAKIEKSSAARTSKAQKSATKTKTKAKRKGSAKTRIGLVSRRQRPFVIRGIVEGQSVGACWHGALQDPVRLRGGDGWHIRRPLRAYGTQTTVDFVERILEDIVDRFPDIHDIAIGDLSAEHGGPISEHSSHQSGRDIDMGLVFTHKPYAYPQAFVIGTPDNLDVEATFVLVEEFAKTSGEPGGVQMIFLDYDVQGLLYHWALVNGESPEYLARLFQYPHGRGTSKGLVRHEPYHADHIHVRFRCPPTDRACR